MKNAIIFLLGLFLSAQCGAQIITTVAGNGIIGNTGDGDLAINAQIFPVDGVFDKNGNFYFTQGTVCDCVRKISSTGIISKVAGGGIGGDGVPATLASLNNPQRITIDTSGNLYIAETGRNRIRKVDISTNIISTVAGTGFPSFSGDGGSASIASLNYPLDIVFDNKGNLFVADAGNNRVRKISLSGVITTFAGNGSGSAATSDSVPATNTGIGNVQGLAIDESNNLYLGIYGRLRKIDTDGIITTVAGTGTAGFSPDGTAGSVANINVQDIAIDKEGIIFLSERANNRIRYIDKTSTIRTIAGTGIAGYSGDGFFSTAAQINTPGGVVLDSCGALYICDAMNYRIRNVSFPKCHYLSTDAVANDINEGIILSPNPATDMLHIQGSNIHQVTVTNILGQCVLESDHKPEDSISLGIAHLPPGMYIVRVNERYVQRLMIE